MLGLNGGLRGKRRVPTTASASGLWFPNEQNLARRAQIWPAVSVPDPNFSSVSLLLDMDGTNGSTVFTDKSTNALTVTAYASAQVSTVDPKFGSGCLLTNAAAGPSRLIVNGSSVLTFPADFTVEFWLKPSTPDGRQLSGVLELNGLGLFVRAASPTSDTVYVNGTNLGNIRPFLTVGTWSFVQVVRLGGVVSVNIDGITRLTGSVGGTVNPNGSYMVIGGIESTSGGEYSNNSIDEFRVTKGIARPNVVPTASFSNL
jgi:hypothetical protein